MFEMIFMGVAIFAITLILQYVPYRMKKKFDFWIGMTAVFTMAILGIVTKDPTFFAGILGYTIGNEFAEFAGWHKIAEEA